MACAFKLLELAAPFQLIPRRNFHLRCDCLFGSADKTGKIASTNIYLDANPPLTTFTADLRRAILFLNVGKLSKRDKMTFIVPHPQIADLFIRGALFFREADLQCKTTIAFHDLANSFATDSLNCV